MINEEIVNPTVTRVITLTKDWQSIGTGKILMCAHVPGVAFLIGDSKPNLPRGSGFPLPDDDILIIETKSIIWVKLTIDQPEGMLSYVAL